MAELSRQQRQRWAKEHALAAAASSWAGISAMRDRDGSILSTADRFMEWLLDDGVRTHHVAVDGSIHDGPAHPCAPCDRLEASGEQQ